MKQFWKNNRGILLFITLMVLFRTSIADWNTVPTGSMKPTILEGDRIWVNKIAYDFKLPLTRIKLLDFASPQRGDIIVFDSARSDNRLVKRVIAMPGDTISMHNNRLYLNGKPMKYSVVSEHPNKLILQEKNSNKSYRIQVKQFTGRHANFNKLHIPDNQYLVLGDNRDNSADSRYIGLVARDEIVGRARTVVMSLNYDNYYLPRLDRFFHTL